MALDQLDARIIAGVDVQTSQADAKLLSWARSVEARPIRVRVDNNLGSITGKVSEFEKSLSAANSRVLAFGASAGQVYLMSRALESLVRSTIEVQKELTNINVILNLGTGQLSKFSNNLFTIANQTGQAFKAVTDVALQFSRQGLGAAEVLKRTADAMTLVRIGGADVETSVKAITATLNVFNEVGLDSTAILNRIATVDTKFSVSGNVIAEALTRVASTAKEAGVSFNSLIGITTALQQITSRGGSVIGNSLKSIFQRIQRPEVIDQLNQMGIATEDLNGTMLSADVILSNLAKKYGDLSRAQQAQITQLAAGLFQANQFKAILGDLAKDNGIAARATNVASTATDQATRRQAELNKTLAAQLNQSLNNIQNFATKAGNIAIAPALDNIFKGLNFATTSQDSVGKFIGEGLLKGLGNYLSGPGLVLGGALISKLFLSFTAQAGQSFGRILETGTARVQNERIIGELLGREQGAVERIVAAAGSHEKVQAIINELLDQQNAKINRNAAALARVAELSGSSLAGIPFGGKPFFISGEKLVSNPNAAGGLIPESSEIMGALRGGYTPGKVKQMSIPNVGNIYYNTAEKIKYFPGLNQPAIIPPKESLAGQNYQKKFEGVHGFDPYAAGGLIPNFSKEDFLKFFYENSQQSPLPISRGRERIIGFSPEKFARFSFIDKSELYNNPKLLELETLEAFPKKQGVRTKFMELLAQKADEHDVDLSLNAYPLFGKGGKTNQKKLFKFYSQFGFEKSSKNPYASEMQRKALYEYNGLIPNFFPNISREDAYQLLKSKQFQSITYQKENGEISDYNSAQYRVRRDKLVGGKAPEGYKNWTEFDEATNSLVLHSTKHGDDTAAKFRRFKIENIKQIRSHGNIYDVFSNGLIPNFALEAIKSAALSYNGDIFEGGMHAFAFEKLKLKYPNFDQSKIKSGFTTNSGKFLNRYDAFNLHSANDWSYAADMRNRRNWLDAMDLSLSDGDKHSSGLVPNFAQLLGEGAYGSFYDLQKNVNGVNVGAKVFNKSGAVSDKESAAYEYSIAKELESKTVSPLFKFPKTLGKKDRVVYKEVFHGDTPADVSTHFRIPIYRMVDALAPFQKLLDEQLRTQGIQSGDFIGHSRNTLLNDKAKDIFSTIGNRPDDVVAKFRQKLLSDRFTLERVATSLAKKGASLGVFDFGLFQKSYSSGLIPNFSSNYFIRTDSSQNIKSISTKKQSPPDGFGNWEQYGLEEFLRKYPDRKDKLIEAFKKRNRFISKMSASSGLVPNFNQSLLNAISREKSAGTNPSSIRVGSSNILSSPDNPMGLGVYNTNDEPLGLNQGINRTAAMGINPKKAGVPNFANEGLFKGILGIGENVNSRLELGDLNIQIAKFNTQIKLGQQGFLEINKKVEDLTKQFALTTESARKIESSFSATLSPVFAAQNRAIVREKQVANSEQPPYDLFAANRQQFSKEVLSGGQLGFNLSNFGGTTAGANSGLVNDVSETTLRQKRIAELRAKANVKTSNPEELRTLEEKYFNDLTRTTIQDARKNLSYYEKEGVQRAIDEEGDKIKTQQLSNFNKKVGGLNLFSASLGNLSPQYRSLKQEASQIGAEGSLQNQIQLLKGRALNASFVLPLLAGVTQQGVSSLVGSDSKTARGISASVGAIGNVASYTATGFGIGGPYGAAIGASFGLLSELSPAVKAFTDTIPDLQRKLEDIRTQAEKTSTAFSDFIKTSEKLNDLNDKTNLERNNVSLGDYNKLIRDQQQGLSQIPPEFRNKIKTAAAKGDFAEANNLFNIAETTSTQSANLISDTILLEKRNSGFLRLIGSNAGKANTLDSQLSQGKGLLSIFGKLGSASGSDAFSYVGTQLLKESPNKSNADRRLLRDSLVNAGINLSGGRSGNGDIKDKTLTAADIYSKLLDNTSQNIQAPISELLGITNNKGFSLAQNLRNNPADISTPEKLKQYLSKNQYPADLSNSASNYLNSFLNTGSGAGEAFQQATSKEGISNLFGENEKLKSETDKTADIINDLTEKLVNLNNAGSKAVSDFEISISSRLSKDLTALKKKDIATETSSRISEIFSGKNDYNKTYQSYIKSDDSIDKNYEKQVVVINEEFNKGVGSLLTDLTKEFLNEIKVNSKGKGASPEQAQSIIKNRLDSFNDVFSGAINIDTSGNPTINPELNKKSIENVRDRVSSEILSLKQLSNTVSLSTLNTGATFLQGDDKISLGVALDKAKSNNPDAKKVLDIIAQAPKNEQANIRNLKYGDLEDYRNKLSGVNDIIEQDQLLLTALNEQLSSVATRIAGAKDEKSSNKETNQYQLEQNLNILKAQGIYDVSDIKSFGKSKRDFSAQAFSLSRLAQISPPTQAVVLEAQKNELSKQEPVLTELNKLTGLGLTNVNQIQGALNNQSKNLDFYKSIGTEGYTGALETQGKIEQLNKAIAQLGEISKDTTEEISQALKSLSAFTDVRSNEIKNINVYRAQQGILTSGDYGRAALAPLQYNTQTLNRDAVVGLEDFSQTLKEDLSTNLLRVTYGATSASKALSDLGLSLSKNLADKASTIGINAIFGLATQAGGAALGLGKSVGGYIPKFAKGGFVGMGSGIQDDVPAFLSGGEFVINKRAVSKIGKHSLDLMNRAPHFADGGGVSIQEQGGGSYGILTQQLANIDPGVLSDTISSTNKSANITLANSFLLGGVGSPGVGIQSSLLSNIGAINADDPQNKVRLSRQKFAYDENNAYNKYKKQLSAYNVQQWLGLGQGFLGAAGTIAGGLLAANSSAPNTAPSTDAQAGQSNIASLEDINTYGGAGSALGSGVDTGVFGLPSFQEGTLGLPNAVSASSSSFGGFSSLNYSNLFSSINKGGFNVADSVLRSGGGIIPSFTKGGFFGGDSSSDKFKAMVMGGEYVVNPSTVKKYGVNYFKGLNDAGKYSGGGSVGPSNAGGQDNSTAQIVSALQQIRDKIGAPSPSQSNSSPSAPAGQGGQTNHITMSFNVSPSDGSATTQSASAVSVGGQNTQSNTATTSSLTKLSEQFKGMVIQTLTQESRPGGLLHTAFVAK